MVGGAGQSCKVRLDSVDMDKIDCSMMCNSWLRKVAELKMSLTEKSIDASFFCLTLDPLIGALSIMKTLLLTSSIGHSTALNFLLRVDSSDKEHPGQGTVERKL